MFGLWAFLHKKEKNPTQQVDHERKGFDEEIRSWRAALREVGYLSGWHVHKRILSCGNLKWFFPIK
ncbi:hypothetical protein CK203_116791 [Vitis vinifera]|uniref:TIR domain-containing protein n=1 Tax=Vitis vinifera TaxID=29760 RepID=A0A438FKJ7_VITVI|nr:hypothetical protein CK203_116791 [Vitis vinifera]